MNILNKIDFDQELSLNRKKDIDFYITTALIAKNLPEILKCIISQSNNFSLEKFIEDGCTSTPQNTKRIKKAGKQAIYKLVSITAWSLYKIGILPVEMVDIKTDQQVYECFTKYPSKKISLLEKKYVKTNVKDYYDDGDYIMHFFADYEIVVSTLEEMIHNNPELLKEIENLYNNYLNKVYQNKSKGAKK